MRIAWMTGMLVLVTATAWAGDPVDPQYTASYRLTFEADWSEQTHPVDFPPGPHFSGLVGATHNEDAVLWRLGEIASTGIESMAETGSKSALLNEVSDLIEMGSAGYALSGGGIATSPDVRMMEFDVDQPHSLVSVTTMIAPSPDWFVGVDALKLRENGKWQDEIVIELQALDSGTDSGSEYTSGNSDTNPPAPISKLTSGPFADQVPIGRFIFELLSTEGYFPISGYHTGLYFDPQRDGEGFNINVATTGKRRILTVVWYSYDDGQPIWMLGVTGLDEGVTEATVELRMFSGAEFGDAFDPDDVEPRSWGTAILRFPSCKNLHVEFDGGPPDATGELHLQRLVGAEGLDCG